MSRADLAEAANRWLYEKTGKTFTMDANQVGKYERGENRWPHQHYRQALCAVLGAAHPAELGFYPYRSAPTGEADPFQSLCPASTGFPAAMVEQPTQALSSPVRIARQECPAQPGGPGPLPETGTPDARRDLGSQPDPGDTGHHEFVPFEPFPGEPPQGETMRRRTLLGLSASALFVAAISADTPESDGPDLVTALTSHHEPSDTEPVSPHLLATAVATAKRQYQSCQYQQATVLLPRLLDQVRTACRWLDGAEQLRAYALAADAYQVAGSILIKHGDIGLAVLAADRSMAAATRSGDPLAVGASARIVTHTLMSSGHLRHATSTAISAAERLDRDGPVTQQALSVTGALLLRGALAAARSADRDTALGLLDEADALAARLGQDANERWTAFGPTNVLLHRVSAAVSLGDAGQAVAYAQRVPLDKIILAERRACLFVDVARALNQWGKPERAMRALLAAEDTAPEEVRTRPAVRRLVDDLVRSAPSSLYPDIRDLADRIGAHR
jgi:tetratricopeptide (TPR) repeat protein